MSEDKPEPRLLAERRKRAGKAKPVQGRLKPATFKAYKTGSKASCGTCFAEPDEPCINTKTGEVLPEGKTHVNRRQSVELKTYVGDSYRLSPEAVEAEMEFSNFFGERHPRAGAAERLRMDPPDQSVIPEEGAYVTFAGSAQRVDGAHSTLKPGETYYAKWAPDTKEGWTKWGQFLITIQTERGPAWLFPDEYVVLQPAHLWYLVQDGTLRFTPSKGLGTGEFGDRVHYIRSRGISLEKAVLMCLGDIKTDIGYFTPVENFDAMWWRFQSVGLTPMEKDRIKELLQEAMVSA